MREIIEEKQIHEHGFVKLLDTMGNDSSIANAARVSYAAGTKTINDDKNLIRYLLRMHHTSPFEQCSVQFHIKVPIFICRQIDRHRTISQNQMSLRYSEACDDFYIPELEYIQPQSLTNKQGKGGEIDVITKKKIHDIISSSTDESYANYKKLLDLGLTRELARTVLPVSNYTEAILKFDLHNFFHFCKLRMDSHAQIEIQDYAAVMYEMVKPIFPIACQAFEDYRLDAMSLSRMEIEALEKLLIHERVFGEPEDYGMSTREWKEFIERWVNI